MVEIGVGLRPAERSVDDRPRSARADRRRATGAEAGAAGPRYRGAQAVAPLSPTTAVYDRAGRYPVVFRFQFAHPVAPRSPLDGLYAGDPVPPVVARSFAASFAPRAPGPGALVDSRV